MSVVILEGPDLAGKSTFAAEIMSLNGGAGKTLLKRGPIREDPMIEYLRPLDALVSDDGTGELHCLVLDRWHVGELIYGPLLRGESQLTVPQANYIEMVLQSLGCMFLHITAYVGTLEERWDLRGDGLIKREWLPRIQDEYWRYVHERSHWVSHVVGGPRGYSLGPYMPSTTQWVGRYVGPPIPAVLLLGDVRASEEFTWPFVPRRATSGHWLMKALYAANVDHMRVGIVNACELSALSLRRLWRCLGEPPVVTLGRNAERAWWMADPGQHPGQHPRQTYLHHPQHQRRFYHRTFAEYGQVIKDAMRIG